MVKVVYSASIILSNNDAEEENCKGADGLLGLSVSNTN